MTRRLHSPPSVAAGFGPRGTADACFRHRHGRGGWNARAFTLIELILVMAMLAIVVSLAAPSLARFFRGRGLDAEVKRFLALTRYGQDRAVSEGIPMLLWIDEEQRRYGLEPDMSYLEEDITVLEFGLASNLVMEVEQPRISVLASQWKGTGQIPVSRRTIRFTPDGFIADTSPERILFRQTREGEDEAALIGQNQSRLNYEIKTNEPPVLRR